MPVEALNDFDRALLTGLNFAHVATVAPDGGPHVTVVWIDADDTHVLINTAVGRAKDRHLRADPRVNVSVHEQMDGYRYVSIRGVVDERIVGDEALDHIDALNRKYNDGAPWRPIEGQVRVLYRILPEHVIRYTGSS
jgi:PPOX class probable F420-dependent enzyme